MTQKKIKAVAARAIKMAGAMALREFYKFDRQNISFKSHHEIVTKVDLASEKIIIGEIKKYFKDHQILSEESGEEVGTSDYLWVVDPIDGTTNFSMHNPLWSVSIGVFYRSQVVLGMVYAPALKELYVAEKGKGASLNGKKIEVSDFRGNKTLNTFCHSANEKDIKKALKYFSYQKINNFDCRQLGSAAIELAFVAAGRVESIMIPGANAWDVAAGVLLVREAGGRVTDFANKEWSLESRDILASNNMVHKQVLKVINL